MASSPKASRAAKRGRRERRFEPQSTANRFAVVGAGALGAALLGAGSYAQFVRAAAVGESLHDASWLLAGGAALIGVALWFGTSGDAPVVVGDGGIGVDKGGVRRVPWHAIESLRYDASKGALVVQGNDEGGAPLTVTVSIKAHPKAAAWVVKEARTRVAGLVENLEAPVGKANNDDGVVVALGALQVVGRRCSETGKIIAYEPDARVCGKCERVYHKASVPEVCPCGASLAELRGKTARSEPPVATEADANDVAQSPSEA